MGAQSGRSSAVGWCIETAFGNVPITLQSGNNYLTGIAATNPLRFLIVEPGGGYDVRPTKDVGVDEQDGDFEVHRATLTGKTYAGKDTAKFDPEGGYYWFLAQLGRDVQTQLAVGAYQHTMTHYKYLPSFSQEEQFGDKTSGALSAGVVFDKLSMNHSAILMATVDYHAHRQIPNRYPAAALVDTDYDFTSTYGLLPSQLGGNHTKLVKLTPTPSYVDVAGGNCGNGPLVFASMTYGSASGFSSSFVTLNDAGVNVKILPGFTIDFMRDIESHMVGGSGYDPSAPVANVFNVSGKIDLLFEDNSIKQATLNNCKFGLNVKFVGPQIGATGFNYSYEVYLPHLKFMENPSPRASSKSVMTGGSFQAIYDASLGYTAQVKLVNAFTNASLAGGAVQVGGGLGGWTNSA